MNASIYKTRDQKILLSRTFCAVATSKHHRIETGTIFVTYYFRPKNSYLVASYHRMHCLFYADFCENECFGLYSLSSKCSGSEHVHHLSILFTNVHKSDCSFSCIQITNDTTTHPIIEVSEHYFAILGLEQAFALPLG